MNWIKISFLPVLFLAFPETANAHLIGGRGLESGITHPLFGVDHLLAMVAVGIISTQVGGRSIWVVPATFLLAMVAGGIISIAGIALPLIETAIALSVLVLGVIIALSKKFSLFIAMGLAGLFALFHGHAHGSEMPSIANPVMYAAGFVFSTTIIHIAGVLIGVYSRKTQLTRIALRMAGAAMSMVGIFLCFKIIMI